MTDLLHVLPDFDTTSFAHILPQLERASITVNDVLIIDAFDVAKRASASPTDLTRLKDEVVEQIQSQLEGQHRVGASRERWSAISTLDERLDHSLGGGVPAGYLNEVTGESAAGKTQLLLSLCLSVQLPSPHGLSKSALYITTEGPLQTKRLSQILDANPLINALPLASRPSLAKIHSIKVSDVEEQDHILTFQVPVAVERHNVGLVVLDSVAANFRAEFVRGPDSANASGKSKRTAFAERNQQLTKLGAQLRHLAQTYNIVVIVANQVLDRFSPATAAFEQAPSQTSSRSASQMLPPSAPVAQQIQVVNTTAEEADSKQGIPLSTSDPLSLDHQQRFITGWGSFAPQMPFNDKWPHINYLRNNLKTPSLGQIWTSQLAARIVMLRSPVYKDHDYRLGLVERDIAKWRRWICVAFAPWTADDHGSLGTEVEVWAGGLRATEEAGGCVPDNEET